VGLIVALNIYAYITGDYTLEMLDDLPDYAPDMYPYTAPRYNPSAYGNNTNNTNTNITKPPSNNTTILP
jgi:hypothetical protein